MDIIALDLTSSTQEFLASRDNREAAAPVYLFDDFILDAAAQSLARNGRPIPLGSRAMQLLLALVENRDRLVGKRELMQIAWPGRTVVENNLSVAICALRQAFDGRGYIRNEYGKGYVFQAPIAVAGQERPASAPVPARSEQPGIAILPFDTVGGRKRDDVLGHGIAEDIIAALSRNRWLRVIARNSSFSYRPGTAAAGEIARDLGVRYVLEGSIRRAGEQVRVIAHLNDAVRNVHLVSERYDRVLADLFLVQDEIAARIADTVRPVLLEAEQERSFSTHADSVDAWLAYQRGNWHLGQRDPEQLRISMGWFRRAIALDPRFPPGYYGLARLLCRAGSGFSPAAPPDWHAQALGLALQAVQLDRRDSGAHGALGYARFTGGDHTGAVAACNAALALNPSDAGSYATLGATLVFSGRPAQGIEALHASLDLDPRNPRAHILNMHIGLGLYFLGDLEATEAHANMMLAAWGDYSASHRLLAMVLAETGRGEQAVQSLARAASLDSSGLDDFRHARMPWYRAEDFQRVIRAFRRAGWAGPGD